MKPDYKQIQPARRKTLFPLSSQDVCYWRAMTCHYLKSMGGSNAGIRQVMNLTPDKVRGYLAKAERILK